MSSAYSSAKSPRHADDQHDLRAVFRAAADGGSSSRDELLGHAVRGALQVPGDVVGCSITQLDGARFATIATSAQLASELDAAQYAMDVGPCVSAARDRQTQPEVSPQQFARSNPAFRDGAARRGVLGVTSLPLLGVERPTGMNFYSATFGGLSSARAVASMDVLSRVVARALSTGPAAYTAAPAEEELAAALARRGLLLGAQDALIERRSITERQAFAYLVADSRHTGRSIFASAREVLNTG